MAIETDCAAQFSSSPSPSSRRCLLLQSRPCWFLGMSYLVLFFPISMKSCLCLDDVRVTRQPYGCNLYGDFGISVFDEQSFDAYYGPGDVCPCTGSFFFQSTLMGFLGEEDVGRVPSLKVLKGFGQRARNASFRMANGEVVSCSLVNYADGIPLLQGFRNGSVAAEGVDFCEGSLVPDVCMKGSNVPSSDIDEHLEEPDDKILLSSPSLPEIEISPPILDWGTKNIYSPSLAILKVINKHNESVLNVYDLFSTNTQFNAYSFQKLSVAPGESASISFIFLPRWLGSSSAQLVLQTSFGGFVIRAKGIAAMSPFQLQPLVGFNISIGNRLSANLSLYNPSIDVLYVKEVATWISISSLKKNHFSAHVSCSTDRFQKYYVHSDSPIDSEWFSLKSGELGSSRVDFKPHSQWEVLPHSSKSILELNLWPHLVGKVSGAICMKLGSSSQETETVILPIDIEVRERESYSDSSGLVSLHFDTLSPCHGKKTLFSISLRNDASHLLNVAKINEESSASKIFEIRYMEGLLLFPGTVTQIALITYNHHLDSKDKVTEGHSAALNCMLTIKTNDSVNSEMSIPCHDLVLNSCIFQSGFHNIEFDGSYIKLISKHENKKCANNRTLSLGNANKESSPFKPKSLDVTESDDLLLENWKSHATTSMMSVLEDQELMFPVVQVGSHYSKWISVHNPSQKPIVMQLVLNSGVIIDQCKSSDDLSEHAFVTKSSHIDSEEMRAGFSIAEYAITEAFVHPLESALFGPVIFRPSNRCMWRSSAFIRNNLSGVEWLPIQAFGGSHALVIIEDSVPIHNLNFDLHALKTSNVFSIENYGSFCNNLFSKELYAKNIGELPLEIIKLKVSGADCGSDGFKIHSCKGFALAPGESRNILISYQSDFSTSVVYKDLELSMATGILVIPMKANVPVYILSMCRNAFFRSMHWKLFLLLLFASFFLLHLMIRIIPQIGATLRQDARNSRSAREEEKFEPAAFCKQFHESNHDGHVNFRKKLGKECFDHHKNGSPPQVGNSPAVVVNSTQSFEMAENRNLTVRVGREKGRRKKRRSSGAGLTAKFDVSGSQSGNSTPSSPLSPNISTPKQALSRSPNPFAEDQQPKERDDSMRHGFEISNQSKKSETARCCDRKWSSSDQSKSPIIANLSGKPSLMPSATFPCSGASVFFASTSSIAPCARAPGSKLCKEETVKGTGNDAIIKEFTYDIWGNHFSEHIFSSRLKEGTSRFSDASEGESYSFFARDPPQSPMMMSVARSASSVLEPSS